MAAFFDLNMFRGDTFAFDIQVTQDGLPVDISFAQLTFAAKRAYLDATPVFVKTSFPPNGINFIDPVNGRARVTIAPADTEDLVNLSEPLVADLRMKDSNSQVTTVASGKLRVNPVAADIQLP